MSEKRKMDKYVGIKKNILEYANQDADIKAIVVIGSFVREEVTADAFSDLDLIIATDNTEKWIIGEYPQKFGNMSISFIEPTLGGRSGQRMTFLTELQEGWQKCLDMTIPQRQKECAEKFINRCN